MLQARDSETEMNDRTAPPASRPVKVYLLGLVAALALSAALVSPFFFSHSVDVDGKKVYQLIATHDLTNHWFVMNQFQESLRAGVLYPRWFAEANNGYGIVVMNYYPPGFYYTTTLANAVFNNWHTTLFALMTLMMAASGLVMYFLARTFFSRAASAAAAAVYMVLPYHLVDLYYRAALPEFFGFVFLPLIFYFAYRAGSQGALRHYAGLGLCYGLHLVTHFPVGLLFSYVLAFYALVWAWRARDWRILPRIAAGMTIGLAISAIYWLPAALEMKLVFEYTQQIFPYHYSYIHPVPDPDMFHWSIRSAFKLNALLIFVTWLIYRRTPHLDGEAAPADGRMAGGRLQVSLWMLLCGASLFMSTAFSYDIGRFLPKLELTVPPFRWLAIAMMFGALLAGACVERLRHAEGFAPRTLVGLRAAFGLLIVLNLWVTYSGAIDAPLKNPSFTPPKNYVESSMTPVEATHPEQLPDTPAVVVEPPGGTSNIVRWLPEYREIRVRLEQPSRVRLKTYNFAGWTARLDGERVPLLSDADGIQVVEAPAGVHTIEMRFQNTAPRWTGTILSLLGFIAVFGLTVAGGLKTYRQSQAERPATADTTAGAGSVKSGRRRRAALIAAGALVVVVIVILAIRVSRNRDSSTGTPPEQRNAAITTGSEAVLFLSGQATIFVALDEPALPELLGAMAAKDADKTDALVHSGRVVRVLNNTKVEVMEMSAGKLKVRIDEGEHAMKTGWVVDRWVR